MPINERDNNSKTPLHFAAENNNLEIVENLIASGANIYAKDKYGCSALHIAVINNAKETVEFLISKGMNVNSKSEDGKHLSPSCSEK